MKIASEHLLFSKLEEGVYLELGEVDLRRLVLDFTSVFEPMLKEKGLGMRLDLEEDMPLSQPTFSSLSRCSSTLSTMA